jgi:hypothetical protein
MDRIAQNRERWTICYNTSDNPLQYLWQYATVPKTVRSLKIRKPNQENRFCTLAKKWTPDSPGLGGELSVVQNNERRSFKTGSKTRLKNARADCPRLGLKRSARLACARPWLADCPRMNSGLFGNHESAQNQIAQKSLPTKIRLMCGKIKTNCHQILTTWSQGNRWATPKRLSPNLNPINGKLVEHEKHRFSNPRAWFAPIYEHVRN